MKHVICTLIAACSLISCRHPDKVLEQRIAGADSMAINYFRGDGTMDTVVTVRIVRDKQQIKKIAGLIAASPAERNYNCGYDGSLHFFNMNQVVQDIDFRMNDGECMYFSFLKMENRKQRIYRKKQKSSSIYSENNLGQIVKSAPTNRATVISIGL